MPKYELMYILGANVSDDQVPTVTEQIQKFVSDFGGTDIVEQQLGKKKLAYPIKKTRNGHYVVVNFEMESPKVNELDARIRTQNSIIRYILVNLEDHLSRLEKDKVAQSKMNPNRKTQQEGLETPVEPTPEESKEYDKSLDDKIEAALSEDIK